MVTLIEIKAGHLNPNTPFWGKTHHGKLANNYQRCRFLSDHEGNTKSEIIATKEIFFPAFDEIVLIEENHPDE